MCARQHKVAAVASYRLERTLLGCADPPLKGVDAPYQCSRVNKKMKCVSHQCNGTSTTPLERYSTCRQQGKASRPALSAPCYKRIQLQRGRRGGNCARQRPLPQRARGIRPAKGSRTAFATLCTQSCSSLMPLTSSKSRNAQTMTTTV